MAGVEIVAFKVQPGAAVSTRVIWVGSVGFPLREILKDPSGWVVPRFGGAQSNKVKSMKSTPKPLMGAPVPSTTLPTAFICSQYCLRVASWSRSSDY